MIDLASSPSLSRSSSPGRTIWNSSPPSRPTSPASPIARCSRCADLLEQLVADRVAERVVDRLEPVEVEQEQRGRADSALPCWASVWSSERFMRWRLASPVSASYSASRVISASDRRFSVRSVPLPTKPRKWPTRRSSGRPEIDHQRSSAPPTAPDRIFGERGARREVEGERPLGSAASLSIWNRSVSRRPTNRSRGRRTARPFGQIGDRPGGPSPRTSRCPDSHILGPAGAPTTSRFPSWPFSRPGRDPRR